MSTSSPALGLAARHSRQSFTERLAPHLDEARSLGRLAWPMIGAGVLNMALSLTDTAMMGWLDPRALASGIVVSDTYSILFYFAAGLVGAVAPLAASAIGAGEDRRAGEIVGQGLWLLLPLALICGLAVASSVSMMGWLGVELPLREQASDYALLMSGAFAFMLVFAWGRSALSAMGRQGVPMLVMVAAVPLNAFGNYLLMYGVFGLPEMGLAGAGASSLIVALVAAASVTAYMFLPSMRHFAVMQAVLRVRPAIVLRLVPVGLMMALATVAETGIYLGSTILMGLVAADALAAHAIVFRMLGLGYVIVVGFGQAVMVLIAGRWGAGDADRLRRARRVARSIAIFVAVLALAIFLAGRQAVLGLEVTDAAYRELMAQVALLLPITGVAMAGLVLSNIHASILRGQTDVRIPALIALGGYWGVGGATMWFGISQLGLGAAGIWCGLAAGTAAAALGTGLYLWRRVSSDTVPMVAE
jgi:multidrug resistance protein, MATE family